MKHRISEPWASFCIATYKRPDILQKTLQKIADQTMSDFEVIISDNDPEGSAKKIVTRIKDKRFKYFRNQENIGMVRNFNTALQKASGKYIVMITDDDPIYKDMLETLYSLTAKYPGYGAYYGACNVFFEDSEIAQFYKAKLGENSCKANLPDDTVRIFSKEAFPIAFYSKTIFPYFLWSVGIVRRKISLEIEGMPDFGSPYLTDFGYISLAGSHSGCVTINKALGHQTVHAKNFGRSQFDELNLALQGYFKYITQRMSDRKDWQQICRKMEIFLAKWMISHYLFLKKYFKSDQKQTKQLDRLLSDIFWLPFMRKFRIKYLIRKYVYQFLPDNFLNYILKLKSLIKN
jgi:glycosyltransferase involved in cell wall biosynthesis